MYVIVPRAMCASLRLTPAGLRGSVAETHRGATFVDVHCGRGRLSGNVYAVSAQGALCQIRLEGGTHVEGRCVGEEHV
jgi:hypothetical protein